MTTSLSLIARINEATEFVRQRSQGRQWRVFIVLGSGLGDLAKQAKNAVSISYSEIPHFAQSTVTGHSGQFVVGDLFGVPVAMMQGRVHFYEGHPMWQVALPVRVAKAMGAEMMIVTNAAGGINREFKVADVMLITDHINFLGLSGNNPLMGVNEDTLGPRFPELTRAYDAEFCDWARQAARAANVTLKEGVYVGVSGPFFETPAELRMFRAVGADAVGMSTVNEVVAARHGGLRVLGFSGITNVARLSPDEGDPPTHEEVMEAAPKLAPKLSAIVQGVLNRWKSSHS
jgi:purine-nucleoside phosphorylase